MEAVLLIGVQASGKSTFFHQRFRDTHVRINLDMLKTRHREEVLLDACLKMKQPFVIDKTNPTRSVRSRYIVPAKLAGFRVVGYYFSSRIADALRRNAQRSGKAVVPVPAVLGTFKRLEIPSLDEGFDEFFYVRISDDNEFVVERWHEDG